ncbi:hypothetical protein PISL3812_07930 [Talaromyces islandicus]|uniref:Uncharacterized protein n=1 Tax=Talaromyces islandicus TaxID=28573 RepID=A0A0U1M5R7_TALIS|nr:hypothetical protein PISL3812_07930 [Talaromyces islandicus]
MNLFHHFQTSTYQTLPLLSPAWKDAVGLAFRYEYLMHAVLCVSASHLAFLSQSMHYKTQSRKHLSCALRLFREALGQTAIEDDSDAILATSALIYYEAWSSPDALATDTPTETADARLLYQARDDQLLALATGMRHLFSSAKWSPLYRMSLFSRTVVHRPIKAIESATLSLGRDPFELECLLAGFYNQPNMISNCQTRQLPDQTISAKAQPRKSNYSDIQVEPIRFPSCAYDSYMSVAARLSILLSLLPGKEENPTIPTRENTLRSVLDLQPDLLFDVARVVYTFSLMFYENFLSMIHDNDPRALLLLYYFYRMIQSLLPKQDCWWASKRAEVMQQRLARRLWG